MDPDERLRRIEERLTRLEQWLELQSPPSAVAQPAAQPSQPLEASAASAETSLQPAVPEPVACSQPTSSRLPTPDLPSRAVTASSPVQRLRGADITTVLGVSGAIALVLSAAYLVQLFVESGWLTPQRQILTATLAGFLLIGGGLLLRQRDRRYAALLPAAGVVILFLSSYAAYLLYSLTGPLQLVAIISGSCLISLALEKGFASPLYSLFAVAGAYATPFLIRQFPQPYSLQQTLPLGLLAFYYLAWSLLFGLHALLSRQRRPYLLAFYLAVIGFALISLPLVKDQWAALASIQALLGLIFVGTTVGFSLRHRQPLSARDAWLHFPGLVLFYATEWGLLADRLPELTPWLAIASAAGLQALLWRLERRLGPLAAGSTLVQGYTSLVLLHAGYWHLLPAYGRPWFVLLLGGTLLSRRVVQRPWHGSSWPYALLVAYILAERYFHAILLTATMGWHSANLQTLLFAALAYGGCWRLGQTQVSPKRRGLLLYAGHLAFAAATARIGSPDWLAVAVAWAGLSLVCLFLGRRGDDRPLAWSGVVLLAASAVLAYAAFFIRLVIDPTHPLGLVPLLLGGVYAGCLYAAGGWLLRQMTVPPLLRLTVLLLAHLVLLLSLLSWGDNPLASALSWSVVAALVWAMGMTFKDNLLLQSFWFVFSLAVLRGFGGFLEALSQREHYWISDGLWGLAYAACSYTIALLCRRSNYAILPLYSGHVAFLAATLILLRQSVWVSASWAVWAIALLILALRTHQPRLGQSSLLIFALSAFKVLAYDLRDGEPLVRVGVLALLGISLYAGGWLYRRLNSREESGDRPTMD